MATRAVVQAWWAREGDAIAAVVVPSTKSIIGSSRFDTGGSAVPVDACQPTLFSISIPPERARRLRHCLRR
jgi:hypothetical protein